MMLLVIIRHANAGKCEVGIYKVNWICFNISLKLVLWIAGHEIGLPWWFLFLFLNSVYCSYWNDKILFSVNSIPTLSTRLHNVFRILISWIFFAEYTNSLAYHICDFFFPNKNFIDQNHDLFNFLFWVSPALLCAQKSQLFWGKEVMG